MSSIPISGPGLGLRIANEDHRMTAEDACTIGDVMAVKPSVATINSVVDTFDTVVNPAAVHGDETSAQIDVGILCVALKTCAAGEIGTFRFRGIVEARRGDTSVAGDLLEAAADGELSAATAGEKACAIAIDTGVDGVNSTVLFDGFNGFSGAFTD